MTKKPLLIVEWLQEAIKRGAGRDEIKEIVEDMFKNINNNSNIDELWDEEWWADRHYWRFTKKN